MFSFPDISKANSLSNFQDNNKRIFFSSLLIKVEYDKLIWYLT